MSLKGSTTEEKIWNYLHGKLGNAYGTAGMMGNLYAESGLRSNNLQNTYEKKLGYTDESYTRAVDDGSYSNFVKDSAGYGLAQWTYWSRKQNLLKYAQTKKASIGDLEMQLDFLMNELTTGYTSVLSALKNATSVRSASDAVLTKFERPADQSETVQKKRASYGQTYYDKYATTKGSTTMTESELRQKPGKYLKQYIGIKEGSTEHKAILAVFNNSGLCSRYKMTVNDAWCATAVSAAFIASDLSSIFPCVECGCENMITKAKNAGIWVENDAYTPKIGDVIMYDWQDSGSGDDTGAADHVGIVTGISGSTITVIEGNKSDTVAYRTLKVNGKYIRGYITPKYSTKATATTTTSSTENTTYSGKGIGTATAKTAMNVRTGPGTSYSTCGSVKKGVAVEVLEVLSSGWYKIVWPGASCGYAYTSNSGGKYYSYTAKSSTSSSSKVDSAQSYDKSLAGTYTVTASALNMRAGAGTGKKVLAVLKNGAKVQNYGYYTTVNGVKWLYLAYNGMTGFCSSAYLKKK